MKRFLSIATNEWGLVLFFVLIGAWFRFANFQTTMFWSNDVARDVLVSWQIATLDEWPTRGHFNTGIQGFYQPYYFYFLGLVAKLGGTPDFLYAVFITLHTGSLVGVYLTAKNLFGKLAGYAALILSVGASSLISLAHFPTVAPWTWPLHIASLTLVSFWFAQGNRKYLWLALAVSSIALQVHGSQLVLLLMILFLIWRQKLTSQEYLAWFGWGVLLLVNQQQFISALVASSMPSLTFNFDGWSLATVLQLLTATVVTNSWFLYGFIAVFGVCLFWALLKQKHIFETLNPGWKFYAAYIVVFEVLLSLQKTGVLPHHQHYVVPVLLVLISGWVVQLKLPVAVTMSLICKSGLLGLFAAATMVRSFADMGLYGDFHQMKLFYAELKQHNLPLQTATILVTDDDAKRLGDASNSVQLWWFLATDLGRSDFNPIAWSLGNYAHQLVIVCNTKTSAQNGVSCDAQSEKIVANSHRNFLLLSSIKMAEIFQVNVYDEGR